MPDSARADLARLCNLRVPTSSGASVRLSTVADIHSSRVLHALIVFIVSAARLLIVSSAVCNWRCRPGHQAATHHAEPACGSESARLGSKRNMAEQFGSYGAAMLAGIDLIFAVLVLLFKRFFKPITILAARPL